MLRISLRFILHKDLILLLRKRYDLIIKKFKVVNFEVFKEKFIDERITQ